MSTSLLVSAGPWRTGADAQRVDVGYAADHPVFQSQTHSDLMALPADAPLPPGKHLVDELLRVAMGARPCADRYTPAGELLPYRIGLGPGYACIQGGTQKFTQVNNEYLLVYFSDLGKPGD